MLFHESEIIELKEKYTDDIKKEIIAFSNTNGGTVYIGVRDNGEIIGVDNIDDITLKIANSCRDSISPDITIFISYNTLYLEGKTILSVQVSRGTGRPYYLTAKGLKPSGVYVRQGNSSAPASHEAIRKMIKETDGDEFEDMRSLNQKLTFFEVKKAFDMMGLEFNIVHMKTLGILNEENIYTNLALLLSDQCPHIIKAATFKDNTQNEFQDRKEFSGSLLKQLNDAYAYLDMRNQVNSSFATLYRIDSRDYSEVAIRESLLNAIVHRDYSNLAGTLISIYKNRIEIISYGGLTGGISLEDALQGLSVCRNRKLANIFYRLNLIEAYGTGLQKIKNSYADKELDPEFIACPNSFKVILPNINQDSFNINLNIELNEETAALLAYMDNKKSISRIDVENFLKINTTAAIRLLRNLKNKNIITTIGKGKNTRYKKTTVDI